MIKRLSEEFVPFASDRRPLQWGKSPDAVWFQEMANKSNWRTQPGDTMQGWYVAGADGSMYGWYNRKTPDDVFWLINRALKKFQEKPPQAVKLEREVSQEISKPAGVIRVFSRIKPLPAGAGELARGLGRDHMWIFTSDIEAILKLTEGSTDEFAMPENVVSRMVRFHLIDNVRGWPDSWEPDQIQNAKFFIKCLNRTATDASFSFHGKFSQQLPDKSRGQEGEIIGELNIGLATKTITRFRAFSEGVAWGASRFTKPDCPENRFPLVIAMINVDDAVSKVTPPEFISSPGYERAIEGKTTLTK